MSYLAMFHGGSLEGQILTIHQDDPEPTLRYPKFQVLDAEMLLLPEAPSDPIQSSSEVYVLHNYEKEEGARVGYASYTYEGDRPSFTRSWVLEEE